MSVDVAAGGRWRAGTATAWRPTAALLRSSVLAVVLLGTAVVLARVDLLVLGAPFAIISVWSTATRPAAPPTVRHRTGNPVVAEGDATTWRVRLADADHVDLAAAGIGDELWLEARPASVVVGPRAAGERAGTDGSTGAATVGAEEGGELELILEFRSMRWGRRLLDPVRAVATSPWGAFRSAATTSHVSLVTLPDTPRFDVSGPMRPTHGLVGLDRSARRGDGSEFAALRTFTPGDRIRRINWARSLRSDELQVNATWADDDIHVELVVDATADYGPSGGIDGVASSLDTAVRAAAAVSQHYVQRGDRVSLRVFGSAATYTVGAASGRRQHRRILETLSALRPSSTTNFVRREADIRPWPVGDAGLTVMLSPLISRVALDRAVQLGRSGVPVVVIDTMPDELTFGPDSHAELAWRLRRLERRREIRRVEQAGIPVVHWAGAGSLDRFLRDVARRASAPRLRVP